MWLRLSIPITPNVTRFCRNSSSTAHICRCTKSAVPPDQRSRASGSTVDRRHASRSCWALGTSVWTPKGTDEPSLSRWLQIYSSVTLRRSGIDPKPAAEGPTGAFAPLKRSECLKSEPLCVPGGAAVFQAAPVLRPAGGGPLLPQLRARGSHGARQPLGGLPEDHHTSPQQQPAGVTWAGSRDCWKPEEGTLQMTGQHERMD